MTENPKPGKFLITNYAMGRPVKTITFEGLERDARVRAESMEPLGMPPSQGKASKSRIVGIKRVD